MGCFDGVLDLLNKSLEDGAFPGAVLSTGDKDGEIFRACVGYRVLYPEKEALDESVLFDMASVTKIMATTMVALKFIESGKLRLEDRLAGFFANCPDDKADITVKHLMTHTSGLPAHVMLEKLTDDPSGAADAILNLGLLYEPGHDVTYSCLGYILLGVICEKLSGEGFGIDILSQRMVFEPLGLKNTTFNPIGNNIASTEWNEKLNAYIKGTVHDENARFLRGAAGNAGVFSDIADCAVFARMLSCKGTICGREFINRDLFEESITNYTARLSEGRGLGFVIKDRLPSSAGSAFAVGSYGHTGFTGTSIWVNPETTQYVVLLTNRVHPTRENVKLIALRKFIHDACAEGYKAHMR